MGGRSFDARNRSVPACVEKLAADPPECFSKPIWRLFLIDCYRGALNDPASRARITRGQRPDHCSDCLAGYRQSMQAQGRCHPPQENHMVVDKTVIRQAFQALPSSTSRESAIAELAAKFGQPVEVIEEVVNEETTA